MRAAANTAKRPLAIAASVTTNPADIAAASLVGPIDTPGTMVGSMEMLPPTLEDIVGAPVESNIVGVSVRSSRRDPMVGAEVCSKDTVGDTENRPPLDPTVGEKVNMSRGEAVGASVKVSLTMMHGDSTPASQLTPDAMIVPKQQSEAPLVPSMVPQPTPPHWPLQASAQQIAPSSLRTPARPFEQVDGTTSG